MPKAQLGFSLVEILLAVSIFGLLVTALVGGLIYGQESTALAGERARAVLLAEEGLEAVRNIRDAGFTNLTDGPHGLAIAANTWTLSGTSDTTDIFTRSLVISSVDATRKLITSTVSWPQNPQRTGSVVLTTYLTYWTKETGPDTTPVSCGTYCLSLVTPPYVGGACRENPQQCINQNETYVPDGDQYCTSGENADTCCCQL